MPMHDWTRVEPGIFHAFHHEWVSEISRALNRGLLPEDYYALPEQVAAGFDPDVLTLLGTAPDTPREGGAREGEGRGAAATTALRTRPRVRFTAQTDGGISRRRKSTVVVRHTGGDRVVAMCEIVSPGNKSGRHAFRAFVDKACELLESGVHLLIVDPFAPGPRDPNGVHAAIREQIQEQIQEASFALPAGEPLTCVAYECESKTRAYIETVSVGQSLPEMPLFVEPDGCVMLPLETTYDAAFAAMPARWRDVLAVP